MNETQSTLDAPLGESGAGAPSSQVAYEQLIQPEVQTQFAARITQEANSFDYEGEVAGIATAQTSLQDQIKSLSIDQGISEDERENHINEAATGQTALSGRRREAEKLRDFMDRRTRLWETRKTMLFDGHEEDVQSLLEGIQADARTGDSAFVHEDDFMSAIDRDKPAVAIDMTSKPVELPVSAFVSARYFQSWAGPAHASTSKRDGVSSEEKIRDFATRETDIPAVDDAIAMVLPDGSVVLLSENAHRVAAAKLKGQETIAVQQLQVVEATRQLAV
jgi:hypothetical protein